MVKIIKKLTLTLLTFIFCSYIAHYTLVDYKLTNRALKKLNNLKKNPFFNRTTARIGNLPSRLNPTSYLKIQPVNNKIKIGFFGDSHTIGTENAIGNDFPSILQKILGNNKYQIINFGQGGYNSNQVYMMADHFSEIFNLDIIFFGPRGFYKERSSTFNNYWDQGNIPYSRFILDEGKLKEIEIEGENLEEKIKKYYSYLPSQNIIKYDHVVPSFLKALNLAWHKELFNPFLEKESELEKIQVKLIEELAKKHNQTIIHYTDDKRDCEKFKIIKKKNYLLYCIEYFRDNFPYNAEISHPSAFGHYEHAKRIANIILNKSQKKIPHFKIKPAIIEKTNANTFLNKRKLVKKLKVYVESEEIATLKSNKGISNSRGRINDFSQKNSTSSENYLYIGLFPIDKTELESLFIKVEYSKKFLNKILQLNKTKTLKNYPNIVFLPIKGKIHYSKNIIHLFENLNSLTDMLLIRKDRNNTFYEPKYPTFKFVVKKDINVYEFWMKNKKNNTIEVMITSE